MTTKETRKRQAPWRTSSACDLTGKGLPGRAIRRDQCILCFQSVLDNRVFSCLEGSILVPKSCFSFCIASHLFFFIYFYSEQEPGIHGPLLGGDSVEEQSRGAAQAQGGVARRVRSLGGIRAECGVSGGGDGLWSKFHTVCVFNKTKPLTASPLQLLVLPREVPVSTTQE